MTGKNTIYNEIFMKMYQSVDWMVQAYNQKDNNRNHVNYGSATAYASLLQSMGHDVDLRVYGDDGYLLTNSIIVDGKNFDFFHR